VVMPEENVREQPHRHFFFFFVYLLLVCDLVAPATTVLRVAHTLILVPFFGGVLGWGCSDLGISFWLLSFGILSGQL